MSMGNPRVTPMDLIRDANGIQRWTLICVSEEWSLYIWQVAGSPRLVDPDFTRSFFVRIQDWKATGDWKLT